MKAGAVSMRFKSIVASLGIAFVSLSWVSTATSASGLAEKAGIQGHVHYVSSKHHVKQPTLPQAITYLNVTDFGAVGDGVTDDTAAIQNAMNAAQASSQGLLFPAGTYLHTSTVTANGISIKGVGAGSVLLANNPASSGVILTGYSPSIQNMVVSSANAGSNTASFGNPSTTTLNVVGGQNFVVQGLTIVQGKGRPGILLQQSSVGQVSSVTFNGANSGIDFGVFFDGCVNTSLVGNLFINEDGGVLISSSTNGSSQSIAIIGNTLKNTGNYGIEISTLVNTIDIQQNQIEIGNAFGVAMNLNNVVDAYIQGNYTYNGGYGIYMAGNNSGASALVTQNVIRNCAGSGIFFGTGGGTGGNFQLIANQFGECGLTLPANAAVISAAPLGGPASLTILNNFYEGHTNNLGYLIFSTGPINVVSGNVQTQTALPNQL
jgi:hypothetical protein